MKILCGDMEFGQFSINGGEGSPVCFVQRLEAVLDVPAETFDFESLFPRYDSYVVPSQYAGEIYFSRRALEGLTA